MIGGHIFDGTQDLDDRPTYVFGLGAEWDRQYGLEAMFNFTDTEFRPSGDDVDVWGARLDGYYNFLTDQKFIPYISMGIGGNHFNQSGSDTDHLTIDYGLGAKYFLNKSFAFRCDLRNIVGYNHNYDNFIYTAGFSWFFPVAGENRETKKKVVLDQDGDGVPDTLDQCKDTPMGISVDAKGCPLDKDQDGVPDTLDQCKDTPMGMSVDAKGCPLDTDQDGVPDTLDQCGDTPMGISVDAQGCPLDTDKDGVYDYLDKCPGTPIGASVDQSGCWEIKPLYFQNNKSDIVARYAAMLDALAAVMLKNPGLNIEIQGYTDSIGSEAYNKELSQRRADTVKAYLVSKGIDAARIKSMGYGESRAVAPNDTPEGRALNRRVIIKIK